MNHFLCKGKLCNKNCCMEFNGISDRIIPFRGLIDFSDIVLSKDDFAALIEHGYQRFIDTSNEKIYKIKTSETGVCSAFSSGKCLIYDFRPTVCKAYPFYIDMFAGLCTIKDCDAVSNDSNMIDYIDDIRAVLEVYKKWISFYEEMLSECTKTM